jgi:thioredoxin-dependent peroxiredoxin
VGVPLSVGDSAPDFDVVAHDGARVKLSDARGRKNVVLYFYPKDFTRVCTQEACGFRDMYDELASNDTLVVGVSVDSSASHVDFAKKHGVTFPLVADTDLALAKAYRATSKLGVLVGGLTARITYVIDKHGKIAAVFDSLLFAAKHLDGVKKTLAALTLAGGAPLDG